MALKGDIGGGRLMSIVHSHGIPVLFKIHREIPDMPAHILLFGIDHGFALQERLVGGE